MSDFDLILDIHVVCDPFQTDREIPEVAVQEIMKTALGRAAFCIRKSSLP